MAESTSIKGLSGRELYHMRVCFEQMAEPLRGIKELRTRRVLDELAIMATAKKENSLRVEKPERTRIAGNVGCKQRAVEHALKVLVDLEIIERVRRGVYRFNPQYMYTGKIDSQIVDIGDYRDRAIRKKQEAESGGSSSADAMRRTADC